MNKPGNFSLFPPFSIENISKILSLEPPNIHITILFDEETQYMIECVYVIEHFAFCFEKTVRKQLIILLFFLSPSTYQLNQL